ncbi:N-formylglutamate amidohydrolase [Nereida sp. MMG025]|uniref:N-formylglutamate amidohydrolase n=1 Tax=Nereida sp. MMG025 TaxID=2909981 RepID=UPI001F17AD65|nr:N-formylglutamate amidohydrolase [Nereida sp. MMG025]MCF6444881.1 N-formylglutamate amidohydrolase [Nereida sp. MMG025]
MPKAAYFLDLPDARTTSVVVASPHSGRDYTSAFMSKTVLDPVAIRSSEDAFVDRLFEKAPDLGAVFLRAGAPRAFLDLNRSCDELDPALIEGVRRVAHNPRVASGLGVIPRVVANGRAIYAGKLSRAEADARIDGFWRPYHKTLQRLMRENKSRFGESILLDCHSMPHEAIAANTSADKKRPDIVIGDRFGASASTEIVERVEAAFANAGFAVARNTPFAGAYITQAYGRPMQGYHAVQIEIDRALYMDEAAIRPRADFHAFRRLITGVLADLVEIGQQGLPLAAE